MIVTLGNNSNVSNLYGFLSFLKSFPYFNYFNLQNNPLRLGFMILHIRKLKSKEMELSHEYGCEYSRDGHSEAQSFPKSSNFLLKISILILCFLFSFNLAGATVQLFHRLSLHRCCRSCDREGDGGPDVQAPLCF